jgi:hypothetical protein
MTVAAHSAIAAPVSQAKTRSRSVGSIRNELIRKSREAALTAVQLFNNPLVQFKAESYIVLMIIAWTYMLHAYYRGRGIDYRYRTPDGRKFARTKHGRIKHWELEHCLNNPNCPLDDPTKANLKLLIGVRHEIEHQMSTGIDEYLNPHLQSCALNFSRYVKELFGDDKSIDQFLSFAIQLRELSREQIEEITVGTTVPKEIRDFVIDFESSLSEEVVRDERYAVLVKFERQLVNNASKADHVIEFVPPVEGNGASHPVVIQERERKKYRATSVVAIMKEEGFPRFTLNAHAKLWKSMDAKNEGLGYGHMVEGYWYWYDSWVDVVRKHCEANAAFYS